MNPETINWMISERRGWKKTEAAGKFSLLSPEGKVWVTSRSKAVIARNEIDWHADDVWPVLFLEFPTGARLTHVEGDLPYHVCLHDTPGPGPKVCQPGFTAGQAVALAWLAWKAGQTVLAAMGGTVIVEGNEQVN